MKKTPVTFAFGDGIGPEIMSAVLRILEAADAPLQPEIIEIGEKVYLSGSASGISDEAWDSLHRTKLFFKAPITTPIGKGYKSLNVTARNAMGLFANVRPCVAYSPYIKTHFPEMDVVIIRENEEDLYAGIEHRQSSNVYQSLKLISRQGCELIVRYAFEYARINNRKKVTCMLKDNIMKMSDGIFHKVFDEIALEFPEIKNESYIIDIGAARLADSPERFDVIVTSNLYGDIISDIAAQVSGSVGIGGSSNIGKNYAMFEAIHGSAPDIAGKNIANPSGLLQAAVMMLVHLNESKSANVIKNAWLKTLEDGMHTADIYEAGKSKQKVGTQEFADAVISNLGKKPSVFKVSDYQEGAKKIEPSKWIINAPIISKKLVGVDVYLEWDAEKKESLINAMEALGSDSLKLTTMTNRGTKVYPRTENESLLTEHWRCRFERITEATDITQNDILQLYHNIVNSGFEIIKTDHLFYFGDERGYSLAQG